MFLSHPEYCAPDLSEDTIYPVSGGPPWLPPLPLLLASLPASSVWCLPHTAPIHLLPSSAASSPGQTPAKGSPASRLTPLIHRPGWPEWLEQLITPLPCFWEKAQTLPCALLALPPSVPSGLAHLPAPTSPCPGWVAHTFLLSALLPPLECLPSLRSLAVGSIPAPPHSTPSVSALPKAPLAPYYSHLDLPPPQEACEAGHCTCWVPSRPGRPAWHTAASQEVFIGPVGHLGKGRSPSHRPGLCDTLFSRTLVCVSLTLFRRDRSPHFTGQGQKLREPESCVQG